MLCFSTKIHSWINRNIPKILLSIQKEPIWEQLLRPVKSGDLFLILAIYRLAERYLGIHPPPHHPPYNFFAIANILIRFVAMISVTRQRLLNYRILNILPRRGEWRGPTPKKVWKTTIVWYITLKVKARQERINRKNMCLTTLFIRMVERRTST